MMDREYVQVWDGDSRGVLLFASGVTSPTLPALSFTFHRLNTAKMNDRASENGETPQARLNAQDSATGRWFGNSENIIALDLHVGRTTFQTLMRTLHSGQQVHGGCSQCTPRNRVRLESMVGFKGSVSFSLRVADCHNQTQAGIEENVIVPQQRIYSLDARYSAYPTLEHDHSVRKHKPRSSPSQVPGSPATPYPGRPMLVPVFHA